jgi:Mrp family chromosome partitioning ATPase/capsular polysaccharide biosynthesis protein
MQLNQVVTALRRFKLLAAAIVVLFTAVGVFAAYSRTPSYKASAILVASPPNAQDSSIAGVQFMLPAVIQQVTTARFRTTVLDSLPAALRSETVAIGATQDQGTGIIHVSASGRDPGILPSVSNAAAKQLIKSKLTPSIKLALLQPAVHASSTTAATRPPIVIASFLLGFIAAVFAALGAGALRSETVQERDLWRRFGLEILGEIPKRSGRASTVMAAFADPGQFEFTEAFHKLVAMLQATGFLGRPRRIAVISSVGGEGKTTVSSGLAYALAFNQPYDVLVVDADLRQPKLHVAFGLDEPEDDGSLEPEAVDVALGNLRVVPALRSDEHPAKVVSRVLPRLLDESEHTTVIVDTPPLLRVPEATLIAHMVEAVILVVEPGRTKVGQLEKTLHDLRRANVQVLGVVLNRVQAVGRSMPYGAFFDSAARNIPPAWTQDLPQAGEMLRQARTLPQLPPARLPGRSEGALG